MKDKDDTPAERPKPTMLDLAKKMDAAVRDAETKRAIVDGATTALATANEEYSKAVATVQGLHTQYQELMQDILSFGGTAHVAKV